MHALEGVQAQLLVQAGVQMPMQRQVQRCLEVHMVQWSNSPMARPHMVAGSDYHMATKLEDPPVNEPHGRTAPPCCLDGQLDGPNDPIVRLSHALWSDDPLLPKSDYWIVKWPSAHEAGWSGGQMLT